MRWALMPKSLRSFPMRMPTFLVGLLSRFYGTEAAFGAAKGACVDAIQSFDPATLCLDDLMGLVASSARCSTFSGSWSALWGTARCRLMRRVYGT